MGTTLSHPPHPGHHDDSENAKGGQYPYGVLPPRDRRLADFQRWAAAKLGAVGDPEHRQLLERFLRWHLLRHLPPFADGRGPPRNPGIVIKLMI